MKAVILAAGEGKRMRPLTETVPKPMVAVSGKPILEHIIKALPKEVDSIVLVVGYLKDKIKNYFGEEFEGRTIRYVEQPEKLGTGHALHLCKEFLPTEPFLFLYADDLHSAAVLKKTVSYGKSPVLLVTKHEDPKRFGVVSVDENGAVLSVEEKPQEPKSNLVSTGLMLLDPRIFNYEPELHESGEYFVTSMFNKFLQDNPIYAIETDAWYPIATPKDLPGAENFLKNL